MRMCCLMQASQQSLVPVESSAHRSSVGVRAFGAAGHLVTPDVTVTPTQPAGTITQSEIGRMAVGIALQRNNLLRRTHVSISTNGQNPGLRGVGLCKEVEWHSACHGHVPHRSSRSLSSPGCMLHESHLDSGPVVGMLRGSRVRCGTSH